MADEHAEGHSMSLVIRETQIKTMMRHCSTPTRTAIIQTRLTASVSKDVEKPKLVCLAGMDVNIKWGSFPLWRMELP